MVSKRYIAHRVEQFEIECEILWANLKVEIKGSEPLHVAAFYRPHKSDSASLGQLQISIENVSKVKGHVWMLRDFNLDFFIWDDNMPKLKQECKCLSQYSDFMGAQWLSGRMLDSRPKGRGFEPHRRHCVVVLEQDIFILA